MAEAQLDAEHASDVAITAMVEADAGIVDMNRPVLASLKSTCTVRRERLQLRVNEMWRTTASS